jgi:transcriptional regulator
MTQEEVFNVLKATRRALTKDEIAGVIGTTSNNVSQNLIRLRKRREVEVVRGPGKFRYTLKAGLRD